MRQFRLSGSEGGAGSIPVPTPIRPTVRARIRRVAVRPGANSRSPECGFSRKLGPWTSLRPWTADNF